MPVRKAYSNRDLDVTCAIMMTEAELVLLALVLLFGVLLYYTAFQCLVDNSLARQRPWPLDTNPAIIHHGGQLEMKMTPLHLIFPLEMKLRLHLIFGA